VPRAALARPRTDLAHIQGDGGAYGEACGSPALGKNSVVLRTSYFEAAAGELAKKGHGKEAAQLEQVVSYYRQELAKLEFAIDNRGKHKVTNHTRFERHRAENLVALICETARRVRAVG